MRPNMYMHNVTTVWPPSIGPNGDYFAPAGNARISMTDDADGLRPAAGVS